MSETDTDEGKEFEPLNALPEDIKKLIHRYAYEMSEMVLANWHHRDEPDDREPAEWLQENWDVILSEMD